MMTQSTLALNDTLLPPIPVQRGEVYQLGKHRLI